MENFTMFKRWYSLAKPSKWYFWVAFITASIPSVFYVLEPIAAARVITSLSYGDYSNAYLWLAIGLLFILLRNISWHINYINWPKLLGSSFTPIQLKIFDKVMQSKDTNFHENSKEKILNIINANVVTVANFSDIIATKLSRLFRIILTMVFVFQASILIGFVVILISMVNFFVLNFLNTKISHSIKKYNEAKDEILEKFNDMLSGRELAADFNVKEDLRKTYFEKCDTYIKAREREYMFISLRDNIFFVGWNLAITLVTMYLVYMLSGGQIELAVYLTIASYLITAVDRINDFFNISSDLKAANVATLRVEAILSFTDKEMVDFGTNSTDDINGEISFNNVSFNDKILDEENYGKLKNASFVVGRGDIVLFNGQRRCGKRLIFYMLRRIIKPEQGAVLLSGINIYDYTKDTYKKNVSYVTASPFFFNDTIMRNLQYSGCTKKEAVYMCRQLGLHKIIELLPEKYSTNIVKDELMFTEEQRFLFGLARALLTKSEVVMIYEFPNSFTRKEENNIKSILEVAKGDRTILIFSANDKYKDICSLVYKIEKGKITLVKGNLTESPIMIKAAPETKKIGGTDFARGDGFR